MKDIDLGKRGDAFWCYRMGMCAASICTSMLIDDAVTELNRRIEKVVPGSLPFGLSPERTFNGGETNPCACQENPATHKHYLLRG